MTTSSHAVMVPAIIGSVARRGEGLLIMAVALATGNLGLAGVSLVPLWLAAIGVAFLILTRSFSPSFSIGLSISSFFAVELLLLRVTPLLDAGSSIPNVIFWTTLAVAAGVGSFLRPRPRARLDRSSTWLAVASITGAFLFTISIAAAQFVPGALRVAWAMNSDAINAMGFARRMLADGGIDSTSTPQPTPLPFGMAAANMDTGRGDVPEALLLEHDVIRTGHVWVFVIAISCVLVGIVVARASRPARLAWSVPLVALASSAMLAWYVIGVQFQFGFMNTAFAIAVLLAAWLAYTTGEGNPLVTLVGLFVAGIALLAVWSPLVVCILGLTIIVFARELSRISAHTPLQLSLAALAPLVFTAYAALITLPTFTRQAAVLGSDGGFPPIGPGSILVIVALTLLAAAVVAGSAAHRMAVGAIAVVVGFSVGLGYLLMQRQSAAFLWGYYPAKFAWTISILLLVILMCLAATMLNQFLHSNNLQPPSRAKTHVSWNVARVVGVVGVVLGLLWGPVSPVSQLPVLNILGGEAFGVSQKQADIVFALAGSHNGQDVLWRTGVGDFWPNAWLLQIDRPDIDPVKIYASVVELSAAQLCSVIDLLSENVVVHTSDKSARRDLDQECPKADYTIVENEFDPVSD